VSGEAVVRLLEGPMGLEAYEGSHGSKTRNRGLPHFRECVFAAAAKPMFSPEGRITESPAKEKFRQFITDARRRAGCWSIIKLASKYG